MGSSIPAEFVIPENLESDLSIGHTFETETMKAENPVGLRFDDLAAGLLTLGESQSRSHTNQRIALETSRHAFAYLIITRKNTHRILAQYTPECQFYTLGYNLRINPLDTENLSEVDAYTDLLTSALNPFALSDKQWLLLHRLLGNTYSVRSSPTLLDFLDEIRAFLARGEFADFSERRDAQFLERLITSLTTGKAGACFSGTSQPNFPHLITSGITIIECPLLNRQIHTFLVNLILAKVCASRPEHKPETLMPPLIVLIDDADLYLFSKTGGYHKESEGLKEVRHWQNRLTQSDVALHLSGDHPAQFYPGTIGTFGTIITHRLNLKADIDAIHTPLKLSGLRTSPYSTKRESTHQQELLRTLEPNSALMTRPDLQTAIPIHVAPFPTKPIGTEFIASPSDSLIQPLEILPAPTMLHKDFTHHVDEAVRILGLLREYQLTPTALSETSGFPEELITYLLETLVAHRYIQAKESGKHSRRRTVFRITNKGETAINEYAQFLLSSTLPSPSQT